MRSISNVYTCTRKLSYDERWSRITLLVDDHAHPSSIRSDNIQQIACHAPLMSPTCSSTIWLCLLESSPTGSVWSTSSWIINCWYHAIEHPIGLSRVEYTVIKYPGSGINHFNFHRIRSSPGKRFTRGRPIGYHWECVQWEHVNLC